MSVLLRLLLDFKSSDDGIHSEKLLLLIILYNLFILPTVLWQIYRLMANLSVKIKVNNQYQ